MHLSSELLRSFSASSNFPKMCTCFIFCLLFYLSQTSHFSHEKTPAQCKAFFLKLSNCQYLISVKKYLRKRRLKRLKMFFSYLGSCKILSRSKSVSQPWYKGQCSPINCNLRSLMEAQVDIYCLLTIQYTYYYSRLSCIVFLHQGEALRQQLI